LDNKQDNSNFLIGTTPKNSVRRKKNKQLRANILVFKNQKGESF